MVVLVRIYVLITSKTVAGRQIYALGGNTKAARLSGIDTRKVFFWVYTNMGILSAVVGAFIMGILNNGMSLYGWSMDIQKIVKGAVLLGIVTVDILSKRKNSK